MTLQKRETRGAGRHDKRVQSLFIAAHEYHKNYGVQQIEVESFFKYINEHREKKTKFRGKFEAPEFKDLEELLADLFEMDNQGKILLESDQTNFTLI